MSMPHLFAEMRTLQHEGKLHGQLILRIRLLFVIGIILLAATVENILRGGNLFFTSVLLVVGYAGGFFIFSRLNPVNWNEKKAIVQAGRLDTVGFVTLGFYIVSEIGFRTYLHDYYPASATAFLFAALAGVILGRATGTLVEIHRVFRAIYPHQ